MFYKQQNGEILCVMSDDKTTMHFAPDHAQAIDDNELEWKYTDKEIIRLDDYNFVFCDSEQALSSKKALKKTEIARARYDSETGGIDIDGMKIATDRGSQALLTAAVVTARLDPEFKTRWKCADGYFVTLDAMQLRAIGDAVIAHVERCFAREAELCELVDAAQTPEDLAAITWSL